MKKNLIKLLVLSAATMATAGTLVACGGNEQPQPEETSSSTSEVTKYTVHFDLNGGTIPGGGTIEDQYVEAGHWAVQPLITPVKEHCTFLGWFTPSGTKWDFMMPIYGDCTLIANWKVDEESKVNLTFDANGGTFGDGASTLVVDTFIGDNYIPSIPTKPGMEFAGWFYGDDIRFTGYVSNEVAEAGKVVAHWEKQDFNFYFKTNDDNTLTITGIRNVESVVVTFPSMINGKAVTRIAKTALASRIYVQTVNIPASIVEIEEGFSSGARALQTINVDSANLHYSSENGDLYNRDKTELLRVGPKSCLNSAYNIASTVKKIGAWCFEGQKDEGMTSINFNEGLEEIGERAFLYWNRLTSLEFPNSLKVIREGAFLTSDTTSKLSIRWGTGLEVIEDTAFFGQYISGILKLPEGLKSIGCRAFSAGDGNGAITDVVLPASLEHLEGGAFWNIFGLKSISVTPGNAYYKVVDNILYTIDGKTCVYVPSDHKGDIVIAEGTEVLGSFAISEIRYYDSLTLPSTLKTIAENAAYVNPCITSVVIPDSVIEIGDHAFDRCSKISSLTIGNGVKRIGVYAFAEIGASSLVVPASVETIADYAFDGCNFSSITLNEGLKTIGRSAFAYHASNSSWDEEYSTDTPNAKLTTLTLPNTLETLGAVAFSGQNALATVNFGSGIVHFGENVFSSSPITMMTASGNLVVKDLALYSTGFETLHFISAAKNGDLVIPNGCKNINAYAAAGRKFTGLEMPATVENIGEGAFSSAFAYGSNITLTLPSALKTIGEGAFNSANIQSIDFSQASSLESIGDHGFSMIETVGELAFPSTLKHIGDYAFYASDVRSISFSEGLESIGSYAFFGNRNLTGTFNIPASLTTMGEAVLGSWGNITGSGNEISSITVAASSNYFSADNGVLLNKDQTRVYAIAGGLSANSVTLPSTVKEIGAFGLADAALVKSFVLPEGLERIGAYAFSGDISCSTPLVVPSTVTMIEERAFNQWTKLQTIHIPHSKEWTATNFEAHWDNSCNATILYQE